MLSAAPVHDAQLVVRQHCSDRAPLNTKRFLCRFGTWSSCTATTSPRCCSCTRCAALPWQHRLSLSEHVQCWLTPQLPARVQFTSFNDQEQCCVSKNNLSSESIACSGLSTVCRWEANVGGAVAKGHDACALVTLLSDMPASWLWYHY